MMKMRIRRPPEKALEPQRGRTQTIDANPTRVKTEENARGSSEESIATRVARKAVVAITEYMDGERAEAFSRWDEHRNGKKRPRRVAFVDDVEEEG